MGLLLHVALWGGCRKPLQFLLPCALPQASYCPQCPPAPSLRSTSLPIPPIPQPTCSSMKTAGALPPQEISNLCGLLGVHLKSAKTMNVSPGVRGCSCFVTLARFLISDLLSQRQNGGNDALQGCGAGQCVHAGKPRALRTGRGGLPCSVRAPMIRLCTSEHFSLYVSPSVSHSHRLRALSGVLHLFIQNPGGHILDRSLRCL